MLVFRVTIIIYSVDQLQYHVHRPAVVPLPTKDEPLAPSPVIPSETPNIIVKEVIQERHYQHRLQQLDRTAFDHREDSYTHKTSRNEPQNFENCYGVKSTAPTTSEKIDDIKREQGDSAHIKGRSNELGHDEPASNDIGLYLRSTSSGLGVGFSKDVLSIEGSTSGARDGKGSFAQSFGHSQHQKDIGSNSSSEFSYNVDHETDQNAVKASPIVPATTRSIRSPSLETDLYEASIQLRRSMEHIEGRYQTAEMDPFDDPYNASSPYDIDPSSITLELAEKSPSNVNTDTEALQKIPTVYDHSTETMYVILDL